MVSGKPTIVLAHGAFADSSGFNAVAKRLVADRYPVVAAPNPLRGLTFDAANVKALLESIEGPIVLVGHSYGGAVISAAAVTDFPDDLVQTQHAFNATYAALAAPRPRDATALRRRLLRLSVRLWWHAYWETVPSAPAARSELRHLARAHGAIRAA